MKPFDQNNPKDKKALEKMKKKSERKAKYSPLTKKQKLALIFASIFFVSAVFICSLLNNLALRLGLCLGFVAIGCFAILFGFAELPKAKSADKKQYQNPEFPNRIACGNDNDILYNEEKKKFVITNIYSVISPVLNFSDIASLEVIEDGDLKIKYSLAGALIGDWAFGTAGAIIGAKNFSKTKHICSKLSLVVNFNNLEYSNKVFEFIKSPIDKNSAEYKSAFMVAKSAYSKLQAMMHLENAKSGN